MEPIHRGPYINDLSLNKGGCRFTGPLGIITRGRDLAAGDKSEENTGVWVGIKDNSVG